ncbi:uncharacterized protein LOC143848245 [Tasmannia lanceolata]|uniref:uncharacterized protein LOC143848245 n=1 Tax=Tasmannia lanceolata TaxID=3420 RepID=UPI004062EDB8
MRGRESVRGGNAPTDLLVCFPSRAHRTLMPKPICSPARPTEGSKRYYQRSNTRGQASPLFRTKTKPTGSDISEPTSPKVTCAGQIKIRPKPNNCKNWQSVMEEIERLHNNQKQKKRPTWFETLGLKKDIMQFLTALRSLRFDLGCFGSFHGSVDATDSSTDEEDEEEQQRNELGLEGGDGSRNIFSKWFMIMQENQNHGFVKEEVKEEDEKGREGSCLEGSVAPPKNALLLMRCRSAPAKNWLEEKVEEEEEEKRSVKTVLEEERKKEKLVLMSYAPDFFKISSDIAKETWVVGRTDPFSRSRSWKR